MICLDTNVVIALLSGPTSPARAEFEAAAMRGQTIAISAIVLFELWYGAAKSARREANARKLVEFMSPIGTMGFDSQDAEEAGDIRAALHRAGTPIGPYDILIAAQARRRGAVLATANTREFQRVPGLQTEDWMAA